MPYDDQVKQGSVHTVPNKPDSDKKAEGRRLREDKPNRGDDDSASDDVPEEKPRKRNR